MTRCETCGRPLGDASQRFCAGDRCAAVFTKARVRIPPAGSIGYTGTHREQSADIEDVSVVSVLEARGPE
jgi:hypothetical protein